MCVHPEVSKEGDRERVDESLGGVSSFFRTVRARRWGAVILRDRFWVRTDWGDGKRRGLFLKEDLSCK